MIAVLMPVNGPAVEVEVEKGWQALAQVIGASYIEIVRPYGFAPRDLEQGSPVLVVDEEGSLNPDRTINIGASLIYAGRQPMSPAIYGNVLVLGEAMVDSGDGYDEPDLVGLEEVPARSDEGWVTYVNNTVQRLARHHERQV